MFEVVERIDNYSGAFQPAVNTLSAGGIKPEPENIEFGQYRKLIGKFGEPIQKESSNNDDEKEQQRLRAKRANEISRMISRNAGLNSFFFDKFLVWSAYVEGNLSEEDYVERVREEVRNKAEELAN